MKNLLLIFSIIIFFILFQNHAFAFESFQKKVDVVNEEQSIKSDIEFSSFMVDFIPNKSVDEISFDYSYFSNNSWSNWENQIIKREVVDAKLPLDLSTSKEKDSDFKFNMTTESILIPTKSNEIKIRLNKSKVQKFNVHFINDAQKVIRNDSATTNKTYNFNYLNLFVPIVTRDAWGCPDQDPNSPYYCQGPAWEPTYFPTTHVIIHHTATKNNATDWAQQVRAIWYYHSHVNDADPNDGIEGWTDIGYNFLIDPNGTIYEGRFGGEGTDGGHTYAHNFGTVSIAMIGTFSNVDITPQARISLNRLTEGLMRRYRINPYETAPDATGFQMRRLSGHRDWNNGATECPGNTFYSTIGRVQEATAYYSSAKSVTDQRLDYCPAGFTQSGNQCVKYSVNYQWSSGGTTPVAATKDSSGNIYVANFTSNKVTKILTDGTNVDLGSVTGTHPRDIAIDSIGNLYTANFDSNNITKIDTSGVITTFASVGANPISMVFDSSDNLYVANMSSNTISKITSDGTTTKFADTDYGPRAIAIDSNDNFYIANYYSNSLTKISNGAATHYRIPSESPIDLEIDSSNNVYVLNYGVGDIYKFDGSSLSKYAVVGRTPVAMTFDDQGNLYTVHNGSNFISKVNTDQSTDELSTIANTPRDIIFNNSIYTINLDSNNLSKLDYTSTYISPTKPIFRFFSATSGYHFFTDSISERTELINSQLKNILAYEQIAFYGLPTASNPDLKPMHRFFNKVNGQHFYTADTNEANFLQTSTYGQANWNHEGIAFYTYLTQTNSDVKPLYRLLNKINGEHLYTTDENEKNIVSTFTTWQYEGIVSYVYP